MTTNQEKPHSSHNHTGSQLPNLPRIAPNISGFPLQRKEESNSLHRNRVHMLHIFFFSALAAQLGWSEFKC